MLSKQNKLFDKYYYLTIYYIARNLVLSKYRDSFLGVIWTLLKPTSQILIFALVMPRIMKFPSEEYVPFLISSMLLWAMISGSLISSSNSLIANAETIKRCLISKTVFPLAYFAECLYNFIIAFIVMYIFSCVFYSSFHIEILLLPLYMIPVLITLASISIALSFITPYVKDLKDLIEVALNFVFWATPVVYPISMFPADKQYIFYFNPLYILIKPISGLIYAGEIPSYLDNCRLLAVMCITTLISYVIYKKLRKNFIFYL